MGKSKRKKVKVKGQPAPRAMARSTKALLRVDSVLRFFFALLLLAIILALYPYTQDATGPIKYLLLAWGVFIAASLLAILGTLQKTPWQTPRIFFFILLAFVGLNLVAALLSDQVGHAMVTWRRFGMLFIVYLIATQIYRKPRHISGLMLIACIGVAFSTLYAISQYVGLDPFPWESKDSPIYRELPGTFGNPNYAAHTMILCIAMSAFLATRRTRRWTAAFGILFLVHMYFTGQRGGLVGLAFGGALVVSARTLRHYVRSPRYAITAALIITAVLVPAALGVTMAITKARTGVALPLERQLLLRYHAYDGATRMLLARPLLGYGPGNYEIANPFFWTLEEQDWFAMDRKMNQHVHNDTLEAGMDAGFPGAVLYLLFLVLGAAQGLMLAFTAGSPQRRRLGWTYAALFCAFLVDGTLGFNLRVPVSAYLIFLLAGAFDGLHLHPETSPPVPGRSRAVLVSRVSLAVLALLLAVYETRVFQAEKELQSGRGAFLANAFTRADTHFARAEALCPWQWSAPFERAKCSLRISQYLEAEKRPADAFAMRNKAVEHFESSVARNPSYILSLLGSAETNLSLGYTPTEYNRDSRDQYLEKACTAADKANRLCPLMPENHEVLGRVAFLRALLIHETLDSGEGTIEQAREQWRIASMHFNHALELGASQPGPLHLMLAHVHIALHELEAAENDLREALASDPGNKDVLPVLYRFGTQHNRFDFVRSALADHIERLRRTAPDEHEVLAEATTYLASMEFRVFKDEEKAERLYRDVVKRLPERAETWAAFAQFSKQSNRPAAFQLAVQEAFHSMRQAGKEPLPQIQAVVSVWEEGGRKLPEATGALARVIRSARNDGMSPADARARFGWPVEVLLVEAQKTGVAKNERGIAFLNIGGMLQAMDQWRLAGTVLQAAMNELPPKQAALAAREAAQVLAHQNEEAQAFELLRKAVALDPDNPDTRMVYARTLLKQGKNLEAREEYTRLLQMPGLSKEAREVITQEMSALP